MLIRSFLLALEVLDQLRPAVDRLAIGAATLSDIRLLLIRGFEGDRVVVGHGYKAVAEHIGVDGGVQALPQVIAVIRV